MTGIEAAAERLADVLGQENAALKRLDFPAAVALVAAKEAALAELERFQPASASGSRSAASPDRATHRTGDTASADNALTSPRAPAVPQSVLALRLVGLATENQILLERAISVQTRIVRIIARAAAPPPAATRYNGYGGRSASAHGGALALSTRA